MKIRSYLLMLLCCMILQACSTCYIVLNKGISGNNSADLIRRSEKDVLKEDPDLVILMVGTNDMVNPQKMLSYKAFEENLQQLVYKFRRSALVLMSPPPVDEGYLLQRHPKSAFDVAPNVRIDSAVSIIKVIAGGNKVGFIDLHRLFTNLGSPSRDASSLIVNQKNSAKQDGVHPTALGYQLIADQVYAFLKSEHLLKRHMKIVCFGDSMTYGAFMKGAGTAMGDTYPAQLAQLLTKAISVRKIP